jgi:hypothetical protein
MPRASPLPDLTPGEYPMLLGWAALAIYGCVPETGQMSTIGLLVIGLLLAEVATGNRSHWAVHALATLVVLWAGLYGATGRGSAVVGAWFAFWPIVLVALTSIIAGPIRPTIRWMIGAIGGLAAVGMARTGGIEPTTTPALMAAGVAGLLSLIAAAGVLAISRRRSAPATGR